MTRWQIIDILTVPTGSRPTAGALGQRLPESRCREEDDQLRVTVIFNAPLKVVVHEAERVDVFFDRHIFLPVI
jgi:hypothetical protein